MTALPPPSGAAKTRLVALTLVAGAAAHVAEREAEAREPGSRCENCGSTHTRAELDAGGYVSCCPERSMRPAEPAPLPRPTLPPAIAADVERLRLAEVRRAARAQRQAKGMQHG